MLFTWNDYYGYAINVLGWGHDLATDYANANEGTKRPL